MPKHPILLVFFSGPAAVGPFHYSTNISPWEMLLPSVDVGLVGTSKERPHKLGQKNHAPWRQAFGRTMQEQDSLTAKLRPPTLDPSVALALSLGAWFSLPFQ